MVWERVRAGTVVIGVIEMAALGTYARQHSVYRLNRVKWPREMMCEDERGEERGGVQVV